MAERCEAISPEGTRCGLPKDHLFNHQNGTICKPWMNKEYNVLLRNTFNKKNRNNSKRGKKKDVRNESIGNIEKVSSVRNIGRSKLSNEQLWGKNQ